ncbi:oxidoreductase [Martelella mediterranea]|uniref:NAD(P)-dependent oxidoreductase n=1 Tax=Martelella TaxID=293088 RepID=UPI001E5FB46A|nr:NAD(P)-dependent oxidoreductase [Martelella mediterranea]MCD1636407.1 oxidoreductase [Martelella mediterranea]
MSGRILITPRSLSKGDHPELTPLTRAGFELVCPTPGKMPGEADLIENIAGCVGWLAGVEAVSPAVIEAARDLRVISRNGTGVDNLPMPEIEARGIAVQRAAGANARGVAELALAFALAGLRDLVPTHMGVAAGHWPRRIGREIHGAEVAVVGLGAIGVAFAEFCLALGANVRGYDPFAPDDRLVHPAFRRCDLNAALLDAEIVSLHVPAQAEPIIGAGEIERLAPGVVIVNTAREKLIAPDAMMAALESGQVAAYATDAFDREPPELTPLLRHPRVMLTSHIGGFTVESVARATQGAVAGLLEVLVHHEA